MTEYDSLPSSPSSVCSAPDFHHTEDTEDTEGRGGMTTLFPCALCRPLVAPNTLSLLNRLHGAGGAAAFLFVDEIEQRGASHEED